GDIATLPVDSRVQAREKEGQELRQEVLQGLLPGTVHIAALLLGHCSTIPGMRGGSQGTSGAAVVSQGSNAWIWGGKAKRALEGRQGQTAHCRPSRARAKRPTFFQRLAKLGRRHPSVVWAAVLLLTIATIGSGVGTVLIIQQRDLAQANYDRAEQILETA